MSSESVEAESGILPLTGDVVVLEKGNGFNDLSKETESINGKLDLCLGNNNVDAETKDIEKKVKFDSEDVLMVKCETMLCDEDSKCMQTEAELVVEKEMVCSHDATLGDAKSSDCKDLGDDSKPDDVECLGGLNPNESSEESVSDDDDDDDDDALVTAKEKLPEFGSDLVWAKVRSHPWWPGQVFDASAATDKAKKYFKKGSFLVTYFGDCSFAWNDASRIKPFRPHFSEMTKQSSLPDFIDAIDFALEEVSRRIEFGLACFCISKEVYEKIKTQNIINPGILEDSSRIHGGDKVSSANLFEPVNLVNYVKGLASSPNYDATDELQFVSHRARLLSFSRWKGYSDLPEFETLLGSVESAPKISPVEEKSSLVERKVSVPETKEKVYTKRRKTEDEDDNGVFEYENTTVLGTKEKTLAEFIAEKRLSRGNRNKSHENSGIKHDSEKKRKVVVHSKLPKSTKKIKANLQTENPRSPKDDRKYNLSPGGKITTEKARVSFGIGASMLRVANQMHSSTSTGLKPCSNATSKVVAKDNGSEKHLKNRPKSEVLSEREISPPPNEIHSSPQSEKPEPISLDHVQSGEVDQVMKETLSTNLVEDSMLESKGLKDSSNQQMVNEDREEAENIVDEITIEEESVNCCKEDSSAE
ncbi:unnamed protein product [Cochlearia groenlandica]